MLICVCRDFTQAREVLETGEYKGIKLRGNAILSYITLTLDGFQNSLRQRFEQSEVLKCTRITHLKNWPTVESLLPGIFIYFILFNIFLVTYFQSNTYLSVCLNIFIYSCHFFNIVNV